ncbi:MAG TPA: phosphogluconate dehydrogenase (NADP(+)-dependent, decarboxylating) [Actinobacteria bacterium]|nr:phosphogluconate dehydrogenase (NADP(+)-dependent, decarboxylating) [Actinomycetota bacterium]
MPDKDIALIGLAVMGQNLALNMESKGYSISVYNRTPSRTREFMEGKARGKKISAAYSLKELISFLKKPGIVMLMVKAGDPVDDNIEKLIPLLSPGDLIIDGGNSLYKDTIRREEYLKGHNLLYIGTGVSGGEEGALLGPAMMPGGSSEAYKLVKDIFEKISAKAEDGIPCVSHIGENGAGHFVKMVHNGIEYGDMQLIGECVWTLKEAPGYDAKEIADIMTSWNKPSDILSSYLVEITGEGLRQPGKGGGYLVDRTADITRMKGTGIWTVQSALELLVPIPTIASAVFSREMSQDKDLRLKVSDKLKPSSSSYKGDPQEFVKLAHDALYIARLSSYAQGFALMTAASDRYSWNLDMGKIAQGWRAGCIIRAGFLSRITREYEENKDIPNLMAAPSFSKFTDDNLSSLQRFIEAAHKAGIPTLALDSAYDYILQITSPVMVSAQVAAQQRDYFGAHGYFKLEKSSPRVELDGSGSYQEYHTEWMEEERPEKKL